MVRAFWLVRSGGQGRGRTADLPLFRIKDHRLRRYNRVYPRCSRTAMGGYRLPCTNMNETKTETGGPAD